MKHVVERRFSCTQCDKSYKKRDHVKQHMRSVHGGVRATCPDCGKKFTRKSDLRRHIDTQHHQPQQPLNPAFRFSNEPQPDFVTMTSPVKPQPDPSFAPSSASAEPRPGPSSAPDVKLKQDPSQASLRAEVPTTCHACDGCGRSFNHEDKLRTHVLFNCKTTLTEQQSEQPARVQQQSHTPSTANSSIPLHENSFLPIPLDIRMKRAVISVRNMKNERSFEYAILTKFIKNARNYRLTANHFSAEVRARSNLNFEGLEFPVRPDKIHTFEHNNPGVSINVYGVDKKKKKHSKQQEEHYVYPLRVTDKEKDMHFDLLFLSNENTSHYAYISNFSRLVARQLNRGNRRLYFCKTCFAYFRSSKNTLGITGPEQLEEHKLYCSLRNPIHNKGRRKGLAHFFGPPPSASLPAQMFQPSPERPQQLALGLQQQIQRSPSFGEAKLTSS